MQNEDTASLLASAQTVAIAIADGDLSEKSNEDDNDKEEENGGDEVNDYQQFPAARVTFGLDQGVEAYMFQRSSASTAESMNAAHKGVRDRTAVDPINSLLLLLKLEARR